MTFLKKHIFSLRVSTFVDYEKPYLFPRINTYVMHYIDRLREKCDLAGLQEEEFKVKEVFYSYLERKIELENIWENTSVEYDKVIRVISHSEQLLNTLSKYKAEVFQIIHRDL